MLPPDLWGEGLLRISVAFGATGSIWGGGGGGGGSGAIIVDGGRASAKVDGCGFAYDV